MTGIAVTGQLPTLSAGEYRGRFVGVTLDAGNKQWITLATTNGAHTEQNDMDVSELVLNDKITFVIETKDGAGLVVRGQQYRLVGHDRTPLTKWTDMSHIYTYIIDNDIELAGPRITSITKLEK